MLPPSPEQDPTGQFLISRRDLLKSGILFAGTVCLSGCFEGVTPSDDRWPTYILRRDIDELFLHLTAIGYRESGSWGRRRLVKVRGVADALLVFTLPPQHFAEVAIEAKSIPATMPEKLLSAIALYPSHQSRLVFRAPNRDRLDLKLNELLAWQTFELVLPDLNQAGSRYDLDVPDQQTLTRIEMPWGVDLIPVGSYGPATISDRNTARFLWAHSTEPNLSGNWAELWTTMLQNVQREDLPIPFEVLGVRGFQRESTTGSAAGGNLVVTYVDGPGVEPPDWLGNNEAVNGDVTTSPIRNMDRIRIATSLSRRFFYTGAPPATNSAAIKYTSKFNPLDTSVNACFENGRTVPVQEFRLGARGGWLKLDSYWTPFTGCGLTGWTHSASLGRDHQVNLRLAGWLFPFGVQAELVTISERAFVKDEAGHFVAPLIKQAFIQVPQPNRVDPGHSESVFRSVSVTTKRTPPLDPPPGPGGSVSSYNEYNFFLPIVDGLPFEFEHVGTDVGGRNSRLTNADVFCQ
jgi:hypothetical protein